MHFRTDARATAGVNRDQTVKVLANPFISINTPDEGLARSRAPHGAYRYVFC